jgi:hypothetical protein
MYPCSSGTHEDGAVTDILKPQPVVVDLESGTPTMGTMLEVEGDEETPLLSEKKS